MKCVIANSTWLQIAELLSTIIDLKGSPNPNESLKWHAPTYENSCTNFYNTNPKFYVLNQAVESSEERG